MLSSFVCGSIVLTMDVCNKSTIDGCVSFSEVEGIGLGVPSRCEWTREETAGIFSL